MKRLHPFLFAVSLLALAPLARSQDTMSSREWDRQLKKEQAQERKAAGPIRVLTNRGKRGVRLTLSDRATTIILPAGWRCSTRGLYSPNPDGTRGGMFSHYFRPVKGGSGGLHLLIIDGGSDLGVMRDWRGMRRLQEEMAAGKWDRFLWKGYREGKGRHPDIAKREIAAELRRNRQRETTLGGLSGYVLTRIDGSRFKDNPDGLLGALPAPHRRIVLFGDTKVWNFSDSSSSSQKSTVQAMLRSFEPG